MCVTSKTISWKIAWFIIPAITTRTPVFTPNSSPVVRFERLTVREIAK